MLRNTYCSNEELIRNLDLIFKEIPLDNQFNMVSISTYLREKSNNVNEESIQNSLCLMADLCSPMLSFNSRSAPFKPLITFGDKRSFMPYDLNNVQLDYMKTILSEINQPQLKARIADFLWTYSCPKEIQNLQIAIENYMSINVCNEYFQYGIYTFWHRAAFLAKLAKQNVLITSITEKLLNELNHSSTDWYFHKLEIAKILSSTKLADNCMEDVIHILISEVKKFSKPEFFNKIEQYLTFIIDYFKSKKDLDNVYEFTNILAGELEQQGDFGQKDSNMAATYFYKLALDYYRKIPKEYRDRFKVNISLERLNNKLTKAGQLLPNELKLVTTKSIDISELQEQSRNHVGNKKTVFETLMYFSGIAPTVKYNKFMEDTKKGIQRSIFSHITGVNIISPDGREIDKIPVLSENNQDEVLLKTAFGNFTIWMQISTQGCIIPAWQQIWQEHIIPKDFLVALCRLSKIIPEKREILVANALYQGFDGDFRTSVYLLAPQVENIVRQLLKSKGIVTTTIQLDGIEHEIGLSSLLDKPEAKDILGNDLWFELQAVFSSSLGPNLRNEVGHGLLDDEKSGSIYSVYAWWMIFRWIIRNV